MITEVRGNILRADVVAVVNPVNTVGVMGRGLALQFKAVHPQMFNDYANACRRGEVQVGKMDVHTTKKKHKFVINFPTKQLWRDPSRIEFIEAGLVDLVRVVVDNEIESIAIPPLGCGLGGLSWVNVRPMIEAAFENLDVDAYLYVPAG